MSAPRPRGAALVRQRVLGIAFLAVIAMLVSLTVALYQKAFTPVVHVTLEAGTVGNQLTRGADVKARGVLVGQVRSIRSTGNGARLDLALDPSRVDLLPKDVSAQLLPKTLFGEKFVALQIKPGDTSGHLHDGDVISQDRTTTALETEKAVNDLLPLLRSLKPADLSATLNALSTALRGRGDQLGSTFAGSASYLKRLNPSLPTLQQDFVGLADLASSTADATPNLLGVLDNLSFSSRSLVQEKGQLDVFLTATNDVTASADSLLRANQTRLVALARDSLPSLTVFAEQSPGYPCLFKSLTALEPKLEDGFGGRQPGLHITLELTQDNGAYTADQKPVYADTGGTTCRGLDPAHPEVPMTLYYNPYDGYYDGQEVDPYTGKPPCTHKPCAEPPTGGRASQQRVLAEAFAPILQVPVNQVPDLAGLLLGPVVQGATLTVR
jgi:phospholipid/cholesterol/gamma-HCH transport system substrate-binding protein